MSEDIFPTVFGILARFFFLYQTLYEIAHRVDRVRSRNIGSFYRPVERDRIWSDLELTPGKSWTSQNFKSNQGHVIEMTVVDTASCWIDFFLPSSRSNLSFHRNFKENGPIMTLTFDQESLQKWYYQFLFPDGWAQWGWNILYTIAGEMVTLFLIGGFDLFDFMIDLCRENSRLQKGLAECP